MEKLNTLLSESWALKKQVESTKAHLQELRRMKAELVTILPPDRAVKLLPAFDNTEDQLVADVTRLLMVKYRIQQMIQSLKGKEKLVFDLRYLRYKTWEKIAEEMDLSLRYVHILHKQGLAQLEPEG